jgi:hypothetical protein
MGKRSRRVSNRPSNTPSKTHLKAVPKRPEGEKPNFEVTERLKTAPEIPHPGKLPPVPQIDPEDAKVVIGIPCYGTMAARTGLALAMQARFLPGLHDIRTCTGTYLHRNRELLLSGALDTPGVTHLMFIDTDLVFPPDGIQRLLALNVDIVGANYNQRSQSQVMERGSLTATVKPFGHNEQESVAIPTEPFKCRAVATGFMLVRLDAVRDMPRPWFFFGEEEGGQLIGEDIWFCDRARSYGLDVWCEPRIPVGHIGEWIF